MQNIEQDIISNFTKNIEFLKAKHTDLYNIIIAVNIALESGDIAENYALEYKDNSYFDIYDKVNNSYLYGIDSNEFKTKLTDVYNLNPNKNVIDPVIRDFDNIKDIYNYSKELLDYTVDNTEDDKEYSFIGKFIFLGTLLGTHIPPIIDKLNVSKCFIYEPNIEIFRLSLFTTQYYKHQDDTEFYFSVMKDEIDFEKDIYTFIGSHLDLNYSIKYYSIPLYEKLVDKINLIVSSSQHTSFHYVTRLSSYNNIAQKIIDKNKILDFNKLKNIFKDKEVLILAAGPSLEKNIEWIGKNKNRYIIVAVSVVLKLLVKYDIKPDIVIELHSSNTNIEQFKQIPKLFLSNTIFLGADHLTKNIVDVFILKNKFIFSTKSLFENSNELFIKSTNVGASALNIILLFNPKLVYMVGIDMAFGDDGIMHISTHPGVHKIKKKEKKDNNINIMTTESLFSVKGNFQDTVNTNSLFYSLYQDTQKIIDSFPNNVIYNLSGGIYFNNTIPLRAKEIKNKINLDKSTLIDNIADTFNKASNQGIKKGDENIIKSSITDLDNILNKKLSYDYSQVKQFFIKIVNNPKYNNIFKDLLENYLSIIIPYIESFLNNKNFNSKDLDYHSKNIAKLLNDNIIKMTEEYKNILKAI